MKPTLPEPDVDDFTRVLYTAETVQRLIDEAYAAGLEDAAQECIRQAGLSVPSYDTAVVCHNAIRLLKEGA